jgi:phosphatidylcholine synthase
MGLVLSAWIAVLIVNGDVASFRMAFALMVVATFVDATDGTLARKVKVKEVLPGFDGRKLDDITDFLNYTFLPLFLVWRADLLPQGQGFWLLVPLLASAYGFCQVNVKTSDGYFLGFPSLWNIVAFYLYCLPVTGGWAVLAVLVLGLLTFVPSRYLYPSQPGFLNMVSNVLAAVWSVAVCWVLWHLPNQGHSPLERAASGSTYTMTLISLAYPAYYFGVSWLITIQHILKKGQG